MGLSLCFLSTFRQVIFSQVTMGDHDTSLPVNLTWRVINTDSGRILNQISHVAPLGTWSPGLYFDWDLRLYGQIRGPMKKDPGILSTSGQMFSPHPPRSALWDSEHGHRFRCRHPRQSIAHLEESLFSSAEVVLRDRRG